MALGGKLVIATHNAGKLKEISALLAPHAGVVLIDDAGSWAGRTVQAGEALMRLA